jgi:hypothetical protein
MNPCGVIVTYIDWKKVKKWFFNIPLFVVQLTLIIMGTVYGKFKWPKLERWQDRIIGVIFMWMFIPFIWFFPKWWSIPILIIGAFIGIATFRYIPWRRVWRAAQASHVRLVLEPAMTLDGVSDQYFWVMNFGYKYAEIQIWDTDWNDGKRFKCYDPTFPTPPEFISPVIKYAHDQVGKGYDELQLISNGLHLIAWIAWLWCWGKELKIIKMFNRKGGREHCISGLTACLRWADVRKDCSAIVTARVLENDSRDIPTKFFPGYSTATTSPCLIELSKNWREA